MSPSPNLLSLPSELKNYIVEELDFPAVICLKLACRLFNSIIPRLTSNQLLRAERTTYAAKKDLYACSGCLRLRPGHEFADKMVLDKRRRRGGAQACNRFCLDCGISSTPGKARYTKGSRITVQGLVRVICLKCGQFQIGIQDMSNVQLCFFCWDGEEALQDEYYSRLLSWIEQE